MSNCLYSANGTLSCNNNNNEKKNNIENFENKTNYYNKNLGAGNHKVDENSFGMVGSTLNMCRETCDKISNCVGVARGYSVNDSDLSDCVFLSRNNIDIKMQENTRYNTFLNKNGRNLLPNFKYKSSDTWNTGVHSLITFQDDGYYNTLGYKITTTDQGWGEVKGSTAEIIITRNDNTIWSSGAFLCTTTTANNRTLINSSIISGEALKMMNVTFPGLRLNKGDKLGLILKALYSGHIAKVKDIEFVLSNT